MSEGEETRVEEIINLSGAAIVDWKSFSAENTLLVKLKGQVCGVVFKNHIIIKHVYLLPHFQDQGLSKEMLESYLFI